MRLDGFFFNVSVELDEFIEGGGKTEVMEGYRFKFGSRVVKDKY